MKCLNCGCASEHFLCKQCETIETLDKLFKEIRFYKPDTCTNPYLQAYAANSPKSHAERDIIPELLAQFEPQETEYYTCMYLLMSRDDRFENSAIRYIQAHNLSNQHTQDVLYSLIKQYIQNNLVAAQKWCHLIVKSDDLCCELYAAAAKYFSMIGDYDLADAMADKAYTLCEDTGRGKLLYFSRDGLLAEMERQKETTQKYRTKKPYWPTTEDRRRIVARFYDERGIQYPRIETKPTKVPENEFAPAKEYEGKCPADYCAFWCSPAFSAVSAKSIYQVAAVKVRDGQITDTFVSLVRPWDVGDDARRSAAKESGIPLNEIEAAEDVDLVMTRFFAFVGDDVLVSTDALEEQWKLLSRAARYTGMREISNAILDLLDVAAETAEEFDFDNNHRDFLLAHFQIDEGKTALEKAEANKFLCDALRGYGG